VFTAGVILSSGVLGLLTITLGAIDAIQYLMMSDDEFAIKYPPETQSAFRW
jgi:hypothetical protein